MYRICHIFLTLYLVILFLVYVLLRLITLNTRLMLNKYSKNLAFVAALLLLVATPAGTAQAFYSSSFGFSSPFTSFESRVDSFRDRFETQRSNFQDRQNSFDFTSDRFDLFQNDFRDRFEYFPRPGGNGGGSDDDPDVDDVIVPNTCPLTLNQLETIENFPTLDGPVIAFGDSLTAGVGAPAGQDYVSELEDLLNINIINQGVSGDTTADALQRLNRDVLRYDPSTVIVWLGGNDILQRYYAEVIDRAEQLGIEDELNDVVREVFGTIPDTSNVISRAETFANLELIIERIQASGAVVILVGYDGERLDRNLNNDFRQLANSTDSIFISDVLRGIVGNGSLTSDFFHPNAAGYDIVADRIDDRASCTQVTIR